MSKRSVLLVEDNEDDLNLMRLAFLEWGFPFEVQVARDGAEALVLLQNSTQASRRAGMILDLNLPKISGHELLKRVRGFTPPQNLPIVVLTSSDDPKDIELARALGASEYLVKPLEFPGLESVVRRLRDIFSAHIGVKHEKK